MNKPDVGLRKLPEMALASYLGLRAEISYSSQEAAENYGWLLFINSDKVNN
jgi:hypothetical protein